ncbi:phosphorylated adapter RNA export protein [Drosophila willistoni]|nr:phosphorylated adapter RNA export protein [Drosophila willistoni]
MENFKDLEDGELSESDDDEIYTPLQRPPPSGTATGGGRVLETGARILSQQIQTPLDDDSQSNSDSSSGESSEEACIKKLRTDGQHNRKRRIKRTVMMRVPFNTAESEMQPSRTRFKKYNVWTAALQEEALSENMRGCDVTRSSSDRNVENYDFSLRYRLNGENTLKRRLSNSSEDEESSTHPANKRGRLSTRPPGEYPHRGSAKNRIGHRSRRGTSSTSGGSSDASSEPRHILDLNELAGRDSIDVAKEMATKLYEEKDELMVRIVELLGIDLSLELYRETQRIEADGGMMIKNGKRRRTPGGVFLFLLKHHDNITPDQQKSIFKEDRQSLNKSRKQIETLMRDRKVEELKICLNKQSTDLPSLNSRKEHYMQDDELSSKSQPGNLSNPPPSPVGLEQGSSPEYKTHGININLVDHTELPSTSKAATATKGQHLVSYDDDFLDVNCGEMDFF